jgi:hypothetical protein
MARKRDPKKYDIDLIDRLMSSPDCLNSRDAGREIGVKENALGGFTDWIKRNYVEEKIIVVRHRLR